MVGALALALALALAGCREASAARTIVHELRDFAYAPAELRQRANTVVTIEMRNRGSVEHELQLGTTARPGTGYATDALSGVLVAVDGAARAEGGDGHTTHVHSHFMLAVGAGKTATATFTVPSLTGHRGVAQRATCRTTRQGRASAPAGLKVRSCGPSASS